MTELKAVTTAEADTYFTSTTRNAKWENTGSAKASLMQEAFRLLNQIAYNQEASCPGGSFADNWIIANSELALALHNNPTAIYGGTVADSSAQGALKKNKLGGLEQEFYDIKDGQVVNTGRFGPASPIVLQRFDWIWDLLGCYMPNVSLNSGSGVIRRVRS